MKKYLFIGLTIAIILTACTSNNKKQTNEPERIPGYKQTRISAITVISKNTSITDRFTQKIVLNKSVSGYTPTAFSYGGNTIKTNTEFSNVQYIMNTPLGDYMNTYSILSVELRVFQPSGNKFPNDELVTVNFTISDLTSADGDVVHQPSQYAIRKAVRTTGKKGGLAKVLELSYTSSGNFRAEIGFMD